MIRGRCSNPLLVYSQLEGLFEFEMGKTYILLSEQIFRSIDLIYNHLKSLLNKNQRILIIDGIGRIRFEELKNRISLKLYEEIAKNSVSYYHPIIHDYNRYRIDPFSQLSNTFENANFSLIIEPSCIFYDPKSCLMYTKEDIDLVYNSFVITISQKTEQKNNISLIFDRSDSPLYSLLIFNHFDDFISLIDKVITVKYDSHFTKYTGFDIINLSRGEEY